MNVKYLRSRATASRLIKANGAKTQMRRYILTEDPVEGNVEVPETQDIIAVILPPTSNRDDFLDHFGGQMGSLDLSQVRSILISVEGLKWNPKSLERILYRGEWWQFDMSMGLDPDGETDILFTGYIRRV